MPEEVTPRKIHRMVLILEQYDAVEIPNLGSSKFFIPMDNARDIVLADLATELNVFNGVMSYSGTIYQCVSGVKKYRDEQTGQWNAMLTGVKI